MFVNGFYVFIQRLNKLSDGIQKRGHHWYQNISNKCVKMCFSHLWESYNM